MKKDKKKKKINVKALLVQLLISALYLLIFGGIGAFLAYNSVYGNPDKTIEQVYGSYEAGSWSQIYELSVVEESKLVNMTTFINAMQNERETVNSNTIKEDSVNKEEDKVTINISYNYLDESKQDTQKDSLCLIKTDEKIHKFFPVWKIDLSDKIVEKVAIKAPYGYKLTVDGIDVSDVERLYFPEENMMKYYFDKIFAGTHAIKLTREGMQDINEYVDLSKEGTVYEVSKDKVVLKEEIAVNAPAIVFGLYQCAFESKGVSELFDSFTDNGCKTLQGIYDNLYDTINAEDGSYLKIIEDVEYDVSVDNCVEGKSVDAVVHFTCTFWAKTPRNMNSGVRKDYQGTAESTVVVHYVVSEGKYIAEGMDFECIDYSQK